MDTNVFGIIKSSCLSLSFSLFVSLFFSFSLSLSLFLSLFVSVFLSLSLSLCLSLFLFLSLFISVFLSLSLFLSLCLFTAREFSIGVPVISKVLSRRIPVAKTRRFRPLTFFIREASSTMRTENEKRERKPISFAANS